MVALACIYAILWLRLPSEIVFVRHGETIANSTGRYNARTIDKFSNKGVEEVASLTAQLDRERFDAIVVSPSPRALKTIAPYLRMHKLRAEVWPELYECCDAHSKKMKGLSSPRVRFGSLISISRELAPYFVLVPGKDRFILAPSYDDGLRQIGIAADRLRRQFGGTGKTVLVVEHSLNGGRLIESLEGKPMLGRIRPDNAKIIRLLEQPNGTYIPARQAIRR